MDKPILVAGGGIGGLSTALALRRAGYDVTVFERAEAFREIGAGLTLTPPGLRALESLGIGPAVHAASDSAARTAFIHHQTGEVLSVTEPPPADAETRIMHRSDLLTLLLAAAREAGVEVRNGADVKGLHQADDQVTVELADGRVEAGSALIGADGLKSAVRALLHGEEPPRYAGQTAWRSLVPCQLVEDLLGGHDSAVHLGPGALFVRYKVRHRALLNCVAIVRTPYAAEESWSTPSSAAELDAQFTTWHEGLRALIARMPEGSVYKWPLMDREPLARWTIGRATLLGDAAHPMLPFHGIGASMALEDAVILARALAEAPTVEQGLALYEASRRDRATEVMLASRKQGERLQDETVTEAFKAPPKPSPIFDYDARTAAIGDKSQQAADG